MDLEKCFLLYFLLYYAPKTVNCDGYGLEVKKYPSRGTEGVLVCTYPPNVKVEYVYWYKEGSNQHLSRCQVPNTCAPFGKNRYSAKVTASSSILNITLAKYEEDEGMWSCKVNNLYRVNATVIVTSLPSHFDFEDPPPDGFHIDAKGIKLAARASCVYPKPNNIVLQRRIVGDASYHEFTKRPPELLYVEGADTNCHEHEHVLVANVKLYDDDFSFLTLRFRFHYEALSKESISTKKDVKIVFPGHPCQKKPCLNDGVCKDITRDFYSCTCKEKYKGDHCEFKVNPCDVNPCKKGEICQDDPKTDTYTCQCTGTGCGTSGSSAKIGDVILSTWIILFRIIM